MRELQLDRRISVPLLEAQRERVQSVAVPVSLPCIAAGNEPFDEPGGMRSQRNAWSTISPTHLLLQGGRNHRETSPEVTQQFCYGCLVSYQQSSCGRGEGDVSG